MGMMAGAGRGATGYYQGRNMRLNAKERDEDRARKVKRQGIYDPIDLEQAMITLDRAKRSGELEEFLSNKGIPQNQAIRKEEIDVANQGPTLRGINRADQQATRREEIDVASQGPTLRGINRADQIGAASLNPALEGIKRGEVSAGQAADLATRQHPGNLRSVDFQDQYDSDQREDYGANKDFWDRFENVNRALQSFRMTGNPKIIMDAYDMYIDDGFEAEITKLPPSKKGGPARYRVETNNDDMDEVEFESAEELAQATEQIFMQHMQANQPMSAYGIGPMSGGRGMDPFTSRRGAGARGSKKPATVETAEYLYNQMRGNPDYAELSEQQLRMRAWVESNYKKEGSPRRALANYFETMMKQFTKPNQFGKLPMDIEEARAIAVEELTWFRDTFYPGERLNIPKAKGDDGGDGYQRLIDRMMSGPE